MKHSPMTSDGLRLAAKFSNDTVSWIAGSPVPLREEIIENWGHEFGGLRLFRKIRKNAVMMTSADFIKSIERETSLTMARHSYIGKFGFVIPCAEMIDACRRYGPSIIEVGAGSGYVTALMRNAGLDVIGADNGEGRHGFQVGYWDVSQRKADAAAIVEQFPHRTVFCSWPTRGDPWFGKMLKAMKRGQLVVIVRESATAEEAAWDYLGSHFAELETIFIPRWPHMHDYCEVWGKR